MHLKIEYRCYHTISLHFPSLDQLSHAPVKTSAEMHNIAVCVLELRGQVAADSQMQDLQGRLSRAKQLCILDMQWRTLSHSSVLNIKTTSQDGMRTGSVLSCNLPSILQDRTSHFNKQYLESSAVISAEKLIYYSTVQTQRHWGKGPRGA